MTAKLYWQPAKPKEGERLSEDSRFFFQSAFGEPVKRTLSSRDLDFLRGAEIATNNGILKGELSSIIRLIEKYGEIIIEERW